MAHITVSDEQAKLIRQAQGAVEVRDSAGNHLGYVAHGCSPEDLAIAKQRLASNGLCYSTAELMQHLRATESQ